MPSGYMPALPATPVPGAQVSAGAYGVPVVNDLAALAPIPLPYYDRQTVSTPVASLSFNVPPNLRRLRVRWEALSNNSGGVMNLYMTLNNDTGSAYSYGIDRLDGGAGASEFTFATTLCVVGIMCGNNGGVLPHNCGGVLDFPRWDGGIGNDRNFVFISTAQVGSATNSWVTRKGGGYYSSTGNAPLTSIQFKPQTGSFDVGTDIQLEGVYT